MNEGQAPGASEPREATRAVRTRTRAVDVTLSQVARSLNERVSVLRHSSTLNEYVCECGRKTCLEPVTLSAEEYRNVRKEPSHFLIAPGHCPIGARVVQELERCEVIEWRPAGAQTIATSLA